MGGEVQDRSLTGHSVLVSYGGEPFVVHLPADDRRSSGGPPVGIWPVPDFKGYDFSNANLKGADLSGSDLTAVNLAGADLSCSNISNANLSGANLLGAILDGADLTGANLEGVDLTGIFALGGAVCP